MKFRYKAMIAAVIACIIELLVFNGSAILFSMDRNAEKNRVIEPEQMTWLNWTPLDEAWVTELDPQILISGIDTYVRELEITAELSEEIPFIVVYYKTDDSQEFSDARMTFTDQVQTVNRLFIRNPVTELRIDLGDNAGVRLQNLTVVLNPDRFHFSLSRVIAMLLIYVVSVGLFRFQKSPEYHLEDTE